MSGFRQAYFYPSDQTKSMLPFDARTAVSSEQEKKDYFTFHEHCAKGDMHAGYNEWELKNQLLEQKLQQELLQNLSTADRLSEINNQIKGAIGLAKQQGILSGQMPDEILLHLGNRAMLAGYSATLSKHNIGDFSAQLSMRYQELGVHAKKDPQMEIDRQLAMSVWKFCMTLGTELHQLQSSTVIVGIPSTAPTMNGAIYQQAAA